MVYGLPQIKEPRQIYEEYCKVKQASKSFKHDLPKKSKKKLELVHSDMYGPFEVRSKGGHRYLLTFMDEFTRYTWIYLIEKKIGVFTKFKKFKLLVEKQVITSLRN